MRVNAMTSHYIDIHLRPDPEIAPHQLMSALHTQLHKVLVQLGSTEIGISFPAHDDRKPSLGSHLRLHGSNTALQTLMQINWFKSMQDHVTVGLVKNTPTHGKHRVVNRVQVKSNAERLRRRAMRRHGLDIDTAMQKIPASIEKRLSLPFVTLGSQSTKQSSFPLFIRHGPLLDQPQAGAFNSYGLSQKTTIPWF